MTDLPPVAPVAKPSAPGRGLRIALAVSVALNLAVVGLVAGAVLRDGPHGPGFVRDLDFGPFGEAMSMQDRAILRDRFFQNAPNFRGMRDELKGDGEELVAVLKTDPLDVARLSEVMSRQSKRMLDRIELGKSLVLERITNMSVEDRYAFADRLQQAFEHGPRGEHGQD